MSVSQISVPGFPSQLGKCRSWKAVSRDGILVIEFLPLCGQPELNSWLQDSATTPAGDFDGIWRINQVIGVQSLCQKKETSN